MHMNDSSQSDSENTLSPKEIAQWARQEIAHSTKAYELRVKEATDLATKYEAGEISPEEAKKRFLAYENRWREALYGVASAENLTDEQILAKIDETRRASRGTFTSRATQSDIKRG
jgi:hypothetical protein